MSNIIIPAILKGSLEEIEESIEKVSDFSNYVQIDIVDGIYGENVTWPFNENNPTKSLFKLGNIKCFYELDLIINKPETIIDHIFLTNLKRCIFHLTSTDNLSYCIEKAKKNGVEAYIGVSINDNLIELKKYIEDIDGVQCMGIMEIGKQGSQYDRRVEDLICNIKEIKPEIKINVDGGIKDNVIPNLLDIGVSQIAVGSALFNGNIEDNYDKLKEKISECP